MQCDKSIINVGSDKLSEIGAISGQVTFSEAFVSAEGTDVFIPGKSFFVRTSDTGSFHLLFVPSGTHTVRIEKDFYFKEVEVTVKQNETTILGEVEIESTDRNPKAIDEVLVGTWSTKCWDGRTTDGAAPGTGTITFASLTSVSYTGRSCFSGSQSDGSGGGTPKGYDVQSVTVVSNDSLFIAKKQRSDNVISYNLIQILGYTNDKITMLVDSNGVEVFERQ